MNLSGLGLDWKIALATALLMLAAMPVQIYSVPGFEITPSLVLAAAAFLLFDPTEKIHYGVVAFLAFCGVLALFGLHGTEGHIRNFIGAASYSSGAPYVLVGMLFARRGYTLSRMLMILSPVAIFLAIIFLIDLYLNNGNTVFYDAYKSTAYAAPATTYVQSFFPFYGTYAVITLATIAMLVGSLALGSIDSFHSQGMKTLVLVCSTFLLFVAFAMWTRQVMLGVIVFYLVLIPMALKSKTVWKSVVVFFILFASLTFLANTQGTIAGDATHIASSKLERAERNIATGNLDDLSTGRMAIYRDALDRLSPRILFAGCGFCNLKTVLNFDFSSLHNVVLTATYKGGIIYAIIYVGVAFWGLWALWSTDNSLGRNVTIAALASIAVQSMVNDALYFQVVPAIMFSITGYTLGLRGKESS